MQNTKTKELAQNMLKQGKKDIKNHKIWLLAGIMFLILFGLHFTQDNFKERQIKVEILDRAKHKLLTKNYGTLDFFVNEINTNEINLEKLEKQLKTLTECLDYNKKSLGTLKKVKNCTIQSEKTVKSDILETKVDAIKQKQVTDKKKDNILKPDELYYVCSLQDNCRVTQNQHNHFKEWSGFLEGGGEIIATDIRPGFEGSSIAYALDYLNQVVEYTVTEKGYDKDLGDYLSLEFTAKDGSRFKTKFGHLESSRDVGDILITGEVIGRSNNSGTSQVYHHHIEWHILADGIWVNVPYPTYDTIESKRGAVVAEKQDENIYYFSSYNLGSIAQNDSTPCIGASGIDLCELITRTRKYEQNTHIIALTVDIRNKMGVKFGDRLIAENIDTGEIHTFQVEDEMNKRFRIGCVKNSWSEYCIKGDIAMTLGEKSSISGDYKITKDFIFRI